MNFETFFSTDALIYLYQIEYNKIEKVLDNLTEIRCNVKDNLKIEVKENDLAEIILIREVGFEPEVLYNIRVAYGVSLRKNNSSDIIWEEKEILDKFQQYGINVINNLAARIAQLIANITASNGGTPIITNPYYM